MRATTALLELFKDEPEWRGFFRSCCETGTRRLRAQAWQFGDELKEQGYPCPTEEVEDALLGLARDLLPESAAAGWDAEWAHELCKDASYLAPIDSHLDAITSQQGASLLDLHQHSLYHRLRQHPLQDSMRRLRPSRQQPFAPLAQMPPMRQQVGYEAQ